MKDLLDMLKMLVVVWLIIIAMLGLPFVLAKIALVCSSEEGLWTECPHSGAVPDGAKFEGGSWTYEVK